MAFRDSYYTLFIAEDITFDKFLDQVTGEGYIPLQRFESEEGDSRADRGRGRVLFTSRARDRGSSSSRPSVVEKNAVADILLSRGNNKAVLIALSISSQGSVEDALGNPAQRNLITLTEGTAIRFPYHLIHLVDQNTRFKFIPLKANSRGLPHLKNIKRFVDIPAPNAYVRGYRERESFRVIVLCRALSRNEDPDQRHLSGAFIDITQEIIGVTTTHSMQSAGFTIDFIPRSYGSIEPESKEGEASSPREIVRRVDGTTGVIATSIQDDSMFHIDLLRKGDIVFIKFSKNDIPEVDLSKVKGGEIEADMIGIVSTTKQRTSYEESTRQVQVVGSDLGALLREEASVIAPDVFVLANSLVGRIKSGKTPPNAKADLLIKARLLGFNVIPAARKGRSGGADIASIFHNIFYFISLTSYWLDNHFVNTNSSNYLSRSQSNPFGINATSDGNQFASAISSNDPEEKAARENAKSGGGDASEDGEAEVVTDDVDENVTIEDIDSALAALDKDDGNVTEDGKGLGILNRPPAGIWRLIDLATDDVSRYSMMPAFYWHQGGQNLTSMFTRIAQPPFFENWGDTYTIPFGEKNTPVSKFIWNVRRPPFDRAGLLSMGVNPVNVNQNLFDANDPEAKDNTNNVGFVIINKEQIRSKTEQYNQHVISAYRVFNPSLAPGSSAGTAASIAATQYIALSQLVEVYGIRIFQVTYPYVEDAKLAGAHLSDEQYADKTLNMHRAFRYWLESTIYLPFTREGQMQLRGVTGLKTGTWIGISNSAGTKVEEILYITSVTHTIRHSNSSHDKMTTITFNRAMHAVNGSIEAYFNLLNSEAVDAKEKDIEARRERVRNGVVDDSLKKDISNAFQRPEFAINTEEFNALISAQRYRKV